MKIEIFLMKTYFFTQMMIGKSFCWSNNARIYLKTNIALCFILSYFGAFGKNSKLPHDWNFYLFEYILWSVDRISNDFEKQILNFSFKTVPTYLVFDHFQSGQFFSMCHSNMSDTQRHVALWFLIILKSFCLCSFCQLMCTLLI